MEVLWKTVTLILNIRIMEAIKFHDTPHIFRTGRGMGTASSKAKLIQMLMDMWEDVLYDIFLDLHKSYEDLDCGRCLDILVEYGVAPRALRLLWRYWDHIPTLASVDGYFGTTLKGQHVVNQGGPLSPILFNVVLEAVFCNWVSMVTAVEGEEYTDTEVFLQDIQRMEAYFISTM